MDFVKSTANLPQEVCADVRGQTAPFEEVSECFSLDEFHRKVRCTRWRRTVSIDADDVRVRDRFECGNLLLKTLRQPIVAEFSGEDLDRATVSGLFVPSLKDRSKSSFCDDLVGRE